MPLTTTGTGAGTIEAGYLNKSSLCSFLGGTTKPLGKSTINDWIKERGFPKPIRLSQTLALWRVSEPKGRGINTFRAETSKYFFKTY